MLINKIGDYTIELETGPIKNPGYRIFKLSYQTHREGRPIKAKMKNRRARSKFISVWRTEEKAELEIRRLQKEE